MSEWIQTYTGRKFWPLDPKPEDVCIEDIAHALSLTCRYGGHCDRFYSVAEHSVLVSEAIQERDNRYPMILAALLHDAAEAYLVDVPRPIKPYLVGFKGLERRVEDAISGHFGILVGGDSDLIKEIDTRILVDEVEALLPRAPENWYRAMGERLGCTIEAWDPPTAERMFLERFAVLSAACQLTAVPS